MKKYIPIFLAFLLCISGSGFSQSIYQRSSLQPDNLRCEYLVDPLGIETANPRLSWTFVSNERNQVQSAYEIIVGDSRSAVEKSIGNCWLTGKINTNKHLHIQYKGKPLKSFTRYYWRVRIYNGEAKPTNWSKTAWFETAMMDTTDWKANWIDDGKSQPLKDEEYYEDDPMPLFRKEFNVQKKIVSARLYISGLGYCEAYINGQRAGDQVLDPGFTTYAKQVLYSVYDITSLLKKGKN
ncbi:MAG TPA: alpha-L-rhamnosidase N-terminal domain-containing protein, partial [Chitinophagaceae bacterium]|nr:alpha-L-rhamnosidase N-terminal domain-containing protein [Chitinophagaceae bacterium]